MITLDTSGYLAIVNGDDRNHEVCLAAFEGDPGPYYVPAALLAEIGWAIEARLQSARRRLRVRDALLEDLASGAFQLDCGENDFRRMHQLTTRYEELRLGLADAAVIASAERHGGRILTTDRRHFDVVMRGEKTIEVVPY